jgi:hypothetical protein
MLLTNTLGVKLAFSALLISTSAITCDSESPPSSSEHHTILTFKSPFLHFCGLICYCYRFGIYNLLLWRVICDVILRFWIRQPVKLIIKWWNAGDQAGHKNVQIILAGIQSERPTPLRSSRWKENTGKDLSDVYMGRKFVKINQDLVEL